MREQKAAKITISLRQELLALADRLARERLTSRSGVFAELLEKEERARVQALMEEGYREMADEDRRLAEEVLPLAGETVLKQTRWGEGIDG